MIESEIIYQWSRLYLDAGYSVIPGVPGKKHPEGISWSPYRTNAATKQDLEKWFLSGNYKDIMLVTGKLSGITVVDADNEELVMKLFTNCPIVYKTRRGAQAIFAYDPEYTNTQDIEGIDGLDIRTEGGITKCPPSLTSDGTTRYEWIRGLEEFLARKLPPFDLIRGKIKELSPIKTQVVEMQEMSGFIADSLASLVPGKRRIVLPKIIGKLNSLGLGVLDVLALLRPHVLACGLQEAEFNDHVNRIMGLYSNQNPGHVQVVDLSAYKHTDEHDSTDLEWMIPTLQNTLRGMRRGSLYVLQALPGQGKTTFLINQLVALAQSGKRVLLFSSEMQAKEILEIVRTIVGPDGIVPAGLFVCDHFTPSIQQFRALAAKIDPDVICLDHFQHVETSHTSRPNELARFAVELKSLSVVSNVAVVVTAQTKQGVLFKARDPLPMPQLCDIAETTVLGKEATVVMSLMPDTWHDMNSPDGNYHLAIIKNRFGSTGMVRVQFDKEKRRFK